MEQYAFAEGGTALAVHAHTNDTNAAPAASHSNLSGGYAMPAHCHNRKQPVDDQLVDAIAMLKEDHQRVRDLFQEYDAARDPRAQRVIAEEACTEIELHAQVEEEIVYPAVEDTVEVDRQEFVEDSLREHQAMKDVIRELRDMGPDAPQFAATFHELQVLVEYHVAKEEADMFPLAEEELAEDLYEMKEEMQELKADLQDS
jgi:hemerythrin-like domain-containing protein